MSAGIDRQRIHERMEKSQHAIERFAVLVEEYRAIRKVTPAGKARDRLDELIQLNHDTMAVLKRTLVISEGDLSRLERDSAKS